MPFGSLFSQRLSGQEAPSEFEGAVVHRARALELISKGELEQAVAELTFALRDTNTDLEGDLLLTRSAAFSSLSEQPKQPEAFLMQGKALLLLERYPEAESALLDGLALDPSHTALQTALRHVSDQAADTRRLSSQRSTASPRAPSVAFMTITLKNILEKSFPQEYAARGLEEADSTAGPRSSEVEEEAPVPLFVMSCLLPGERMALNIFEPRYRLMVRRCMEGSRRFGMATVRGPHHQLDAVACLAEIIECNPLPDGRYYVEIMGRQRFRIQQAWEQDGYRIARPAYFMDGAPASTEEEHALVQQTSSIDSLADQWIQRLRAMFLHGKH
ncbi:hypothetical protein WJX73_001951 [Symbiochloris irregularis]|uniref:Lon N-terminal domain-containing protein n=1 Tax=Symbiochloris irregularis TaxID=706552 RepID=A0AAW1PPA7_9CHLO